MSAKKWLGQHFLVSPSVIKAVEALCSSCSGEAEAVLEIGPGKGAMTKGLLKLGLPVIAVEKDEELARALQMSFPDLDVRVGDAKEITLETLIQETDRAPWLVAGNLPYNVGTKILLECLRKPRWIAALVVMIQREVAQKFCAECGEAGYGFFSAWSQAFWHAEMKFPVPPGAFRPPPAVVSEVCLFLPKTEPWLDRGKMAGYWEFLKAAFGHPRKTLAGNLSLVQGSKKRWREDLGGEGLLPGVRADQVPARTLCRLYHHAWNRER